MKKTRVYRLPIGTLDREDIVNLYVNEHYLIIFLKNEIIYYQMKHSPEGEYTLSTINTSEKQRYVMALEIKIRFIG